MTDTNLSVAIKKVFQEFGKQGGRTTERKHSSQPFSAAGKLGMAKRWGTGRKEPELTRARPSGSLLLLSHSIAETTSYHDGYAFYNAAQSWTERLREHALTRGQAAEVIGFAHLVTETWRDGRPQLRWSNSKHPRRVGETSAPFPVRNRVKTQRCFFRTS